MQVPLVALALLMAIIVNVLALIRYAHGGEKMLCHLEPLATGWHYRTKIPPRPDLKCWYDGERMKDRRELYWAEAPSVPAISIMGDEQNPPESEWRLQDRWKGE